MQLFNSYYFIIALSLIIIMSYLFNVISKKTSIPSVLLLIFTGMLIKQGMKFLGIKLFDFFPILEVLGIVGVIMIVLEAALDLELKRERWPIIWKSMVIAILGFVISTFVIACIIHFIIDMEKVVALLYAIPLSILSSAIIIPSIGNLPHKKREFLIYESTFSDIIGIMMFYIVLGSVEISNPHQFASMEMGKIGITALIAIVVSYVLIFIFQNITTQVKLFLLLAILVLLYSISKLFHLSSLLIILVFGLMINNYKLFFRGFLKRWLKEEAVVTILKDFKLITSESAFVIRTFFFIVFGITIMLSSLLDIHVIIVSCLILSSLYLVRLFMLKIFLGKDILPELYIAPRGLITILLFFAIPEEIKVAEFKGGILLFIILITSIIMTYTLLHHKKKGLFEEELLSEDDPKSDTDTPLNEMLSESNED